MKLTKKTAILAAAAGAASAAAAAAVLESRRAVHVTSNGVEYESRLTEGRTFIDEYGQVQISLMLALRLLGGDAHIGTNPDGETFYICRGDTKVSFAAGMPCAEITEGEKTYRMHMDTVPAVRVGASYVPLRYLAAAFGKTAIWDSDSLTADLRPIPVNAPEVTLYLVRHGKTLFNTVCRVQGWSDSPLTKDGTASAIALGRALKEKGVSFSSAWASDLGRHRDTARLILQELGQEDLELCEDRDLREVCFGSWEGELESVRDEAYMEAAGMDDMEEFYRSGQFTEITCRTDTTGLAEDAETVETRMLNAVESICQACAACGGGSALAVSSVGAIGTLAHSFGAGLTPIPNASVTIIRMRDGVLFLDSVGKTLPDQDESAQQPEDQI